MIKKQPEYEFQKKLCRYLEIQHKNVLFLTDTIASVKLNIKQATRNKAVQKKGFKCPDLLILEPNKKYSGLFLELKIESPFKKNGELKKCEHLEGQNKSINELNKKGYLAMFIWDFETAKKIIDKYLKNEL